jgi:spore germination protein YaaH
MSKQRLRHFVGALICGLVPLIPAGPVQAASAIPMASPATRASAVAESAVLQKFRDSGPPTMAAASQFEATAPIRNYATQSLAKPQSIRSVSNTRLFREVFGFAFASSLGDPTIGYPSWNFSLLSTVAYFGVHVDWSGDFSNDSGLQIWNDPNGPVPGFIQTAHANGTKVVLTIEMFDSTPGTRNMCSALQQPRSGLTIQRTVAQINARGIDGVNIDYESNNSQCTDPSTGAVQYSQSLFTTFVHNMRVALPSTYISVDTYSGAAGYRDGSGAYLGFFDIGALANDADSFFVMAYDMEYANWDSPPLSCPNFCIGPTAPLSTYLFNDGRASSEYRAVVPGSKVIMGIPYYGRKVCVGGYTPSTAPPNAVGSTTPVADGYLDASTENGYIYNSDYQTHREVRDLAGNTKWDTWTSSVAQCTREMYWDDATALGNKYNLVVNDGLRGAGIFALNYGGGAPELWNLILQKFGQCSNAAISADKATPQIPGTAITFTASAFCAGTAQYQFSLQSPGGGLTVPQPYSGANTWTWNTTGLPLGTYSVQVAARNLGSPVSYDTLATISFRLARCLTPTFGADHPSPQLPGTSITFTAAGTCSGTPEYQFSETAPGGTTTVVRPYSGTATYGWATTPSSLYGAYSFSVDLRVTGVSVGSEASQSLPFSLTSCSGAALTTNKTSPQPTGTTVGVGGSATCVSTPQYRFVIQPPGGPSAVVQDFSGTSTFSWIGNGIGGTYLLELDAKGAAQAASTMQIVQLTFVLASCSAVTLAANPASPQPPGTAVVLTATATCPGTAQYRFSITKPNQGATVVQDFGGINTYGWNTTGLPLGDYGLKIDVKNLAATAAEAAANSTYTLANPACTTPVVTTDLASPQGDGVVVTFSATTTTCPSPLYRFYYQTAGASGWTLLQDYSASRSYSWLTTGAPGGNYRFEVDVRDSTRPVAYDQYTVAPFVINACALASLSPSVPSPQTAGTQVTVTASSTSSAFCPNPLYKFWILASGSSTWQMVQDYSTSATFNWNSTGAVLGTYHLGVWVRDASSPGAGRYDSNASIPFVLALPHCASVTVAAAPASPSTSSTQVTFTATATGCSGALYAFWARWQGYSTWQLLQGYSTSNVYHWNSTGAAAGTEYVGVWAKDPGSATGSFDANMSIQYSVTTPSCASVTASGAPITVVHGAGTHVTITAAAAGCTNASPLYEFWMRTSTTDWQLVQAYSNTATYDWNSTGAPVTTVYFGVWAKDARSPTSAFDANVSVAVPVT